MFNAYNALMRHDVERCGGGVGRLHITWLFDGTSRDRLVLYIITVAPYRENMLVCSAMVLRCT
jgi:hypothetical protein